MPISHLQYILIFYTSTIHHISIIILNNKVMVPSWTSRRLLVWTHLSNIYRFNRVFSITLTLGSFTHHIGHTDLTIFFTFGSISLWLMSSSDSLSRSFGLTDPWFQYLLLATSAVSGILYHVHSQTSIYFQTGPDISSHQIPLTGYPPWLHHKPFFHILTDPGFSLPVIGYLL